MARGSGRAARLAGLALLAAAAGAAGAGGPRGRGLLARAPGPACASLRARACRASRGCQWGGPKRKRGGSGCVEAANECEVVEARRGRRRRCQAVVSTQCECSRKKRKCGKCRLAPPGADAGYVCKSSAAEALAALQDPQIYSKGMAPSYGPAPFQAAIDFAEELASFVREEQQRAGDDSPETNTLRVAFYTKVKDEGGPCVEAGGGGSASCLIASWSARGGSGGTWGP